MSARLNLERWHRLKSPLPTELTPARHNGGRGLSLLYPLAYTYQGGNSKDAPKVAAIAGMTGSTPAAMAVMTRALDTPNILLSPEPMVSARPELPSMAPKIMPQPNKESRIANSQPPNGCQLLMKSYTTETKRLAAASTTTTGLCASAFHTGAVHVTRKYPTRTQQRVPGL